MRRWLTTLSCRARHVKCDEGRPSCNTCRSLKVVCGGYGKRIYFDVDGAEDVDSGRFRRPLFTDQERQLMSEELVASTGVHSTSRLLSQLDQDCEDNPEKALIVARGPFRAFRASKTASSSSDANVQAPIDIDEIQFDGALDMDWTENFDFDSSLNQELQLCATNSSNLDTGIINNVQDWYNFETMDALSNMPAVAQITDPFLTPLLCNMEQSSMAMFETSDKQVIDATCSPLSIIQERVPADAVYLLKHYAATVPSLITPIAHSKTPWHVLFLPLAKQSLAALTLGEELDHASSAAFYGTLALSAFSLGSIHRSSRWLEQGKAYKQQAREYTKVMLRKAYEIPKLAKYKNILMALITMTQVSLFSGNRDQTECYFLEAEKFIRLKGLNRKRKSRKVRLLHHCYAFERVIYESTAIAQENVAHRSHVRSAIKASGMDVHCVDGLSFRPARWVDLSRQMKLLKGQEEGENDLHLEVPGAWPPTLYPEVFGVPEAYIMALSFIIRLGKEKDAPDQGEGTDSFRLHDFLSRAKTLEKWVNQLRGANDTPEDSQSNPRSEAQSILHDVMQNALSIYFYRRIYDVDSSMLQSKVKAVKESLSRLGEGNQFGTQGSVRFIWPAFVAACEAEDPECQIAFSEWFRNAARRSGFRVFERTIDEIEQIWEQKSADPSRNLTWLEFARK